MSEKPTTNDQSQPANLPVPVISESEMVPIVGGVLSTWHRMDMDNPAEAEALYRAMNGESEEWKRAVGKELHLRHVIFQKKEFEDKKTGEIKQADTVIAITVNGEVYGGTSVGIIKSCVFLSGCRGLCPWEPPVKVKVVALKAAQGELLRLDLIDLGKKGGKRK